MLKGAVAVLKAADTCGGCVHDARGIACGKKHVRTETTRMSFFTLYLRPRACKGRELKEKLDASR